MLKYEIAEKCPDVQGFNDQDFLDIALKELSFYALAADLSPYRDDYDEPHLLRAYTGDDRILHCKVTILKVSIRDKRLGQVEITGNINLGYAGHCVPDSMDETNTVLHWISKFTINVRRGLLMPLAAPRVEPAKAL